MLSGMNWSASLLYFPTGGGKSEAFFGLLDLQLFLDRLRGKNRGVTALIRSLTPADIATGAAADADFDPRRTGSDPSACFWRAF